MTKIHDNEFYLNMSGIANFQFEVSEHCITTGQTWGGVSTKTLPEQGEIIVKAGRSGSEEVAKWFKDKVFQGSSLGCSSSSSLPKKLNFAFIGTMSFEHTQKTYIVENVVIGQGHSTRNTWWIGGPEMTGIDTPIMGGILCATNHPLARVCFSELLTSINKMSMGVFTL
ncbi:MAG: hypothetical protein HRT38_16845 [Alteromonadaceae bacterium]|nr:hypothetical protein [Alteromonadaceae bacterium]